LKGLKGRDSLEIAGIDERIALQMGHKNMFIG
jgi:hypothetical protein